MGINTVSFMAGKIIKILSSYDLRTEIVLRFGCMLRREPTTDGTEEGEEGGTGGLVGVGGLAQRGSWGK